MWGGYPTSRQSTPGESSKCPLRSVVRIVRFVATAVAATIKSCAQCTPNAEIAKPSVTQGRAARRGDDWASDLPKCHHLEMSLKQSVNRILSELTGHQLVKATTIKLLEARAATRERDAAAHRRRLNDLTAQLADQASRIGEQVARIEALTKPKPKPVAKLPADYDDDMRAVWPLVSSRTMTGHEKTNLLIHSVKYVERYAIPGAIVECGVWRGGSMLSVAYMLDRLSSRERDLYLFDTFTGMTEPTDRDMHIWVKKPAGEVLSTKAKGTAPIWAPASLEDVKQGFEAVNYPPERLHYVPGKVEDTIPHEAPDQIAILRLDTDWYESTRHELTHLYGRLVPGGVLILDDYGSWQGSKDATDEFLADTDEPLMLTRVNRGRVAIKPGLNSRV